MLLKVNPHKIEIDKSPVNEREINISKCTFEFADEITNDYVKEAYFTFEGTTYKQIIVNDECDFPSEVLVKKGQVKIGVVAYLVDGETEIKRYNPSPAYFNTWDGSLVDNAENSEPITPTDKEQIEQNIANLQNDVEDLEENKQDTLVSGENIKTINGESVLGTGDIEIDVDLSDYYTKEEVDQSQATQNDQINANKGDIESLNGRLTNYSLITETGAQILLNINSSNYQMTAILKDKNGNVIYTSNVIDLPIESMIINATYDDATKEIVFTLQNGNVLRVSVADLVSGLVSTDELNTILGNYYTKSEIDSLLTDYVKNTDYATTSKAGLMKPVSNMGVYVSPSGALYSEVISYANYANLNGAGFISKGTLENVIAGKQLINQTTLDESQAEQDANIEENASNIEELQSIVDQLPHETGEGTDIKLEPTIEAKMSIGEFGNSSQFSTTGKQLLHLPNGSITNSGITGTITNENILTYSGTPTTSYADITGTTNDVLPEGTYTLSIDKATQGERIVLYLKGGNAQDIYIIGGSTSVTFTTDGTNTNYRIGLASLNTSKTYSNTIKIQLEKGSTATSYEPYTGGIPAPSPDYPYPVKVVTGENGVIIQNKNLFDGARKNTYFNSAGVFANVTNSLTTSFIPAKEGDIFTIYSKTRSNGIVIASFDENYNLLLRNAVIGNEMTHTCPANTRFIIGSNYSGMTTDNQLEKGSSATPYVEYEEQNYQLSLGNIELCKIGDYQDYIYKNGDNWYKKELIGKLILSRDLPWSKSSTTEVDRFGFNTTLYKNYSGSLCTHFIKSGVVSTIGIWFNNSSVQLGFNYSAYGTTTLQQWLNWLDNNNVLLYQPLVTPQDVLITDQTLINQLNDIYENAHSYKGTTNITSTYEDGNEQMIIDASALMDIGKKIDTLTNAIIELGGE